MKKLIDPAMDRIFETLGEEEDIEIRRGGIYHDYVPGIFCDKGVEIVNEYTVISSSQPQLLIRESDLPDELKTSDRLMIRGEPYKIRDTDQDGYGNLILELFKVGT
ncbi:MAG: hypothetical protein HRU19_32070 [Pseudobacteriovorax sp.]|nr:hypothetical protein [Pseudobacteriovorax sp.]